MSPFTEYTAVQDYLFGLKARGVNFGVDRMRSWAGALGHPESRVPLIHVAGTNGKGSTAAMLESIYRRAGLKTGLYTSPHLVRLGERVQIDRRPLSDAEITSFTNELMPVAERVSADSPDDHPSFFEFMTAMAFLQFARSRCDVGIVEVGMGGRLDATNIITPAVSVITSISLDHCEFLGDTIEKIAAEKAGVIKTGVPVVLGHLPAQAEKVTREIAASKTAPVFSIRDVFGEDIASYPRTLLQGNYQRWNAATAALTVQVLRARWPVSDVEIHQGLMSVSWVGRWQPATLAGREVIFDASHNPEGASVLEENLRDWCQRTATKPVVVTGVLGVARARPLLEVIARHAHSIHLVVPNQARACSREELRQLIPASFAGEVVFSEVDRLFPGPGLCHAGDAPRPVLITGSIYLLGEILTRLAPELGKLESRLQDF